MLKSLFRSRVSGFRRELQRQGFTLQDWIVARRSSPVLYTSISDEMQRDLCRTHPERVRRTLDAAERILRHEFNLLGSGPFVPIDRNRDRRGDYAPIDWYLDPVRAVRFPTRVPADQWDLYKMRPPHADIKYPWELARCQHWAVLGQAFRFTRDDRFALEVANQLDDFVESNPVGVGVNWTCTMDEALRAINWAIGLELMRDSNALDEVFWERAHAALFAHGVFIRGHLENTYEVTSNHYLSNVVGLWFLGAVFSDLHSGAEWFDFARSALEHEVDVQVLSDGADFESSIPYHRLVTELFLGALRLGDARAMPLSPGYRNRVRDMAAYLVGVVRPDGLMPQVGDADDGRLHVLGGYGTTSPQDARHLFGAAGAIFGMPDWSALGGESGAWESAWWGLAPARVQGEVAHASRIFPDAGVAVMRAPPDHWLLVTNGAVGTKGFGNHKHNDLLSFEYHHGGIPLVVDPGSYVYTSDFDARNLFRSTSMHNTLQVDGHEQNEMKPEWIFRLFETAHPEHVSFRETAEAVEYTGRHHGYERFDGAVTHERTFRLSKPAGSLTFTDRVSGRGPHELRWHFHLAPGLHAAPVDACTVRLSAAERTWVLRVPVELSMVIEPSSYSPSYGLRQPCLAINLTTQVVLDGDSRWAFSIE